jgi:hypothetical protein
VVTGYTHLRIVTGGMRCLKASNTTSNNSEEFRTLLPYDSALGQVLCELIISMWTVQQRWYADCTRLRRQVARGLAAEHTNL